MPAPLFRTMTLTAILGALSGSLAAAQPAPAQPVVVELFQSQGCSSCPPANANLNAIADRPDVLALSFGVTYWDDLGWKDTFARPQYTQRQWDYAASFRAKSVGTPQIVIGGHDAIVGASRAELDRAIAQAKSTAALTAVIRGGAVSLSAGAAPARPAVVWLVHYDPRVRQVAIRRGENGGKTLPHRNIVVDLVRLGEWRGQAVEFKLPAASDPALKTAVLVQAAPAGIVLAAAKG